MLQMVHPDRVVDEAGFAELPLVEPVYPLTEGLGARQCAQGAMDGALRTLPELPEWQDEAWLARERLPAFARCAARAAPPGRAARRRCRKAPPGRGLPMTNCWPASWRLRWCARICAAQAGRGIAGDGRLRAKHHRGAALFAHAFAAAGARRHRRRSRAARSACCGCCKATSAPARPWSRCSPPRP